ncbi:MAG: sulfotransferase domain-containing protein [Nostoc sp. S4]|nr:sulfotransferase domain-containing protein [Nostoc sp. S4]
MLKQAKQILKTIELTEAYYCSRNKFVASLLPFKSPTILLLSYPRSGSSWIGEILAKSESVTYLREPITQPYLKAKEGKYTLIDIDNNPLAYSIYRELSDKAFRGRPHPYPDVINNIHHFSLLQRRTRHLLIKEVNPKAAGFYCQRYCPKILFILRHPAAVALSFARQGWLESPDTQLDTGDLNASVWEKFGYAYGSTIKYALDIIQKNCAHEIILYENLALYPQEQFRRLFQLLELDIPKNYEEIVQNYCYSENIFQDNYQTRRISKHVAYKWCEQLSNQEIALIRKGFTISGLRFYSDDAEWLPK